MTPQKAAKIWRGKTKLHRLRVKNHLSQNELSNVSGVPKSTIICYENKSRPIESAKLNTLCDLANVLNCKIDDLLESKELIEKYNKVK